MAQEGRPADERRAEEGRKDEEEKSRKTDLENPADRFCVRPVCMCGYCVCYVHYGSASQSFLARVISPSLHLSRLRLY